VRVGLVAAGLAACGVAGGRSGIAGGRAVRGIAGDRGGIAAGGRRGGGSLHLVLNSCRDLLYK
jgi:hypothetical protein